MNICWIEIAFPILEKLFLPTLSQILGGDLHSDAYATDAAGPSQAISSLTTAGYHSVYDLPSNSAVLKLEKAERTADTRLAPFYVPATTIDTKSEAPLMRDFIWTSGNLKAKERLWVPFESEDIRPPSKTFPSHHIPIACHMEF